jgi:hypothetical protein
LNNIMSSHPAKNLVAIGFLLLLDSSKSSAVTARAQRREKALGW